MKQLEVQTDWCGKNYAAYIYHPSFGLVTATARTWEELEHAAAEALAFHIEGCKADEDKLPDWIEQGEYNLVFTKRTSVLLHEIMQYTNFLALSKATGIKQAQLSHYATGRTTPRPEQRQRIVEGMHKIGRACLNFA